MRSRYVKLIVILFTISLCLGCVTVDETLSTSDWSDNSHGNAVDPDYDTVFRQNEVLRFDIVISPEDWATMQQDMVDKYGNFGSGDRGGPGGPGFSAENPVFVPCRFYYNGTEWYKVGIRFKGNSSLMSCWRRGIAKLPFKLDFDQFEDDYPEINDQRFYGFKQLSLSNNFMDQSLIREKVTADIFRESGIRAPQTAFCRVYVDYGEGSRYFGLYTLVEVVDDTMLSDQFGSKSGNCYKPDGNGASFAYGTFSESVFVKKTNEEQNDWSDIIRLFEILHSNQRNSDPEGWRIQLEGVFNSDYFLKWLAVNTVIQNWDTYGKMTHNYYLYNNPEDRRLYWIPWDNNEALSNGKQGGALSISFNEVSTQWPLIRFLIDDPLYRSRYLEYINNIVNTTFEPAKRENTYRSLQELIRPYVIGGEGEQPGYSFLNSASDFDQALNYLIDHVSGRYQAVKAYIDEISTR